MDTVTSEKELVQCYASPLYFLFLNGIPDSNPTLESNLCYFTHKSLTLTGVQKPKKIVP